MSEEYTHNLGLFNLNTVICLLSTQEDHSALFPGEEARNSRHIFLRGQTATRRYVGEYRGRKGVKKGCKDQHPQKKHSLSSRKGSVQGRQACDRDQACVSNLTSAHHDCTGLNNIMISPSNSSPYRAHDGVWYWQVTGNEQPPTPRGLVGEAAKNQVCEKQISILCS